MCFGLRWKWLLLTYLWARLELTQVKQLMPLDQFFPLNLLIDFGENFIQNLKIFSSLVSLLASLPLWQNYSVFFSISTIVTSVV
jgi:hypothetical protein